jgi:hypothetical protein
MIKRWIFLFLFVFTAAVESRAGIFELGASYNYKKTNYDASHYDASESGTASLAYYFWESMAGEFSFTRGAAIESQPEFTVYQDITAYGVSLLWSVSTADSSFKPYIKGGVSYVTKILRYYYPNFPPLNPINVVGPSPTAGIGFKYMLSQRFGIKIGVDGSQTTSEDISTHVSSTTYDFSANAGISFLF